MKRSCPTAHSSPRSSSSSSSSNQPVAEIPPLQQVAASAPAAELAQACAVRSRAPRSTRKRAAAPQAADQRRSASRRRMHGSEPTPAREDSTSSESGLTATDAVLPHLSDSRVPEFRPAPL